MAVASLLTLLAWCGVAIGVVAGQARALSSYWAAVGGGLLFGIALFWLVPEIALASGWAKAVAMMIAACAAFLLLDRFLLHAHGSPGHTVLGPLLVATAAHSFLDGWSVSIFSGQPLTGIAVPLGLAIHKIPEGLAVGWIARKSFSSPWPPIAAAFGAETMTLVGAFAEPRFDQPGALRFGPWWSAIVLAVIAGSFLFLGIHAVLPARRRRGVVAVFVATFAAVGAWCVWSK